MSFLYTRTISIRRQNTNPAAGVQGYGGVQQDEETVVWNNINCHIEAERIGARSPADLPADSKGQPIYLIIIKINLVPLGGVLNRDIIVDDLGQRYQVISADPGPLVTTCRSEKLES